MQAVDREISMSGMLTEKQRKLLRILFERTEPITAVDLARETGVSERTARTYVHAINRLAAKPCIEAGSHGYTCDKDAVQPYLAGAANQTETPHVPQTANERCAYVINRLLQSNQALRTYDLSEELFISASTMSSVLSQVRKRLGRYDLSLAQDAGALSVIGTEKSKRRLLSELLYEEASVAFMDEATIQQAFPDIDAAYIRSCVVESLNRNHFFVNDYSLINIVLHIAIAIDRIRTGSVAEPAEQTGSYMPGISAHDREIAAEIARELEHHFDVTFSPAEREELALLLSGRTTVLANGGETREGLERIVGADILALVDKLVGNIEAFYYINLSEHQFYVRFALHIKNLIARGNRNAFARNPLTEEIRSSCPLLYDGSVMCAGVIKEETGIQINDDEIAYIAFHIGGTLEAQRQLSVRVRTVLYCPAYFDIDKGLQHYLDTTFKNDIIITSVATTPTDLERLDGIELIIATTPIKGPLPIPIQQIRIVPSADDTDRIRQIVSRIQHDKRRASFREHLSELTSPELFVRTKQTVTQFDAVEILAGLLERGGYVDSDYQQEIWERERLSATAFGTVAVPHALKPHAKQSGIAVLIPAEPIDWSGAAVSLVLMLSFSLRERSILNEVFDPLVSILIDPAHVDILTKANSYQEFISNLSTMIE